MSVIKAHRNTGKLEVLTKASALCAYTVQICKNEKNFPKRDRWILTQPIVREAVDSFTCMRHANAVKVVTMDDYKYRRAQQVEAYSHLEALLGLIDIAYNVLSLGSDRVEFWTGSILEVEDLLQGWRESDRKRYESILKDSPSDKGV